MILFGDGTIMLINRVYNYVQSETWKSINKIVKNRSLMILYRGVFVEKEYNDAIERLQQSWSDVNFELIENGDDRVIVIKLIQ